MGTNALKWRVWSRTRPRPEIRPDGAGPRGPGLATEGARAADPFLDLHRRVLAAFEMLSDAPDEDRRIWLQETAVADSALATEVAALLLADRRGPRHLPTSPGPPANDEPAAYPLSVGPYRLVRRLGGGMGDVFLAERDDGLFQHTVAIKLITDGRAAQRLSEHLFAERKILAGLQHPNIAQLFGGGTTPEGLPFIVMEYLDGELITEHIHRLDLGLPERLRLFLTVCEAVQFAHQNLIVHADIKPSNILVTETSRVKLLDFGIARWLDPRGGGAMDPGDIKPMTRAYAAPERLDGAEPSVSADVYSLGVLLYEILADVLPDTVPAGADAPRPLRQRG